MEENESEESDSTIVCVWPLSYDSFDQKLEISRPQWTLFEGVLFSESFVMSKYNNTSSEVPKNTKEMHRMGIFITVESVLALFSYVGSVDELDFFFTRTRSLLSNLR